MDRFAGKVAVVTGGASGIGEATVRRLVGEGAKVVFADWDGGRGTEIATNLAGTGNAVFVEADVSNEAAAAAVVDRALNEYGGLDMLVNNAGIRMYQTVVEASAERVVPVVMELELPPPPPPPTSRCCASLFDPLVGRYLP